MSITLGHIYSYPVKSLSASPLGSAMLTAGGGLPDDRRFAIMHGASAFNPFEPEWQPKSNFVVLSRTDKLAALETEYDPATTALIIRRGGRQVARGLIGTPLGRGLIDQFLAAYLKGAVPGTPRLVEAAGVTFSDKPERLVSIVNAASVADLERVVKEAVNPLRFRPNLVIGGVPPWEECGWVGQTLAIGGARLEVSEIITRCPAINVEPGSGSQSLNLLMALERGYGHRQCGLYARVVAGGPIALGDALTIL
ncbi:MAG: MOSC domain-containing protein [Rhodospirillaceae bacterium]